MDCDWTPATKDRYFNFLREVKRQQPTVLLSVAVRLHQYRDRTSSGIPPADRGLLMCYNMAPVQERAPANAIYDWRPGRMAEYRVADLLTEFYD